MITSTREHGCEPAGVVLRGVVLGTVLACCGCGGVGGGVVSIRPALVAARLHARLVARPTSLVFHVYSGPLTPSGGSVPRSGRPVCGQRTRRLTVLERTGGVVDLGGRRMCHRCRARLVVLGRAVQPPVKMDDAAVWWSTVELRDLVTAIAATSSVNESHAVGTVLDLCFPPPPVGRPETPSRAQALYDVHAELHRLRRHLRVIEMTPEQREKAQRVREDEAADRARLNESRRKAAAMDRAIDRRNAGQYLRPHERALIDSA